MSSDEDANKAIEQLNAHPLDGRTITVAEARPARTAATRRRSNDWGGGGGGRW